MGWPERVMLVGVSLSTLCFLRAGQCFIFKEHKNKPVDWEEWFYFSMMMVGATGAISTMLYVAFNI